MAKQLMQRAIDEGNDQIKRNDLAGAKKMLDLFFIEAASARLRVSEVSIQSTKIYIQNWVPSMPVHMTSARNIIPKYLKSYSSYVEFQKIRVSLRS